MNNNNLKYHITFLHPYKNIIANGLGSGDLELPISENTWNGKLTDFKLIYDTMSKKEIGEWKYKATKGDSRFKLYIDTLSKLFKRNDDNTQILNDDVIQYIFIPFNDGYDMGIYRTVYRPSTNTWIQSDSFGISAIYNSEKNTIKVYDTLTSHKDLIEDNIYKKLPFKAPYIGKVVAADIKDNINDIVKSKITINNLLPTIKDLHHIHGAPDIHILNKKYKQPNLQFIIKLYNTSNKCVYSGIIYDIKHTKSDKIPTTEIIVDSLLSLLAIPTLPKYLDSNEKYSSIKSIKESFDDYHLYDETNDLLNLNINPDDIDHQIFYSRVLNYDTINEKVLFTFRDCIYNNILRFDIDYDTSTINLNAYPDLKHEYLFLGNKQITKYPTLEQKFKVIELEVKGYNTKYYGYNTEEQRFDEQDEFVVGDNTFEIDKQIYETPIKLIGILYNHNYNGNRYKVNIDNSNSVINYYYLDDNTKVSTSNPKPWSATKNGKGVYVKYSLTEEQNSEYEIDVSEVKFEAFKDLYIKDPSNQFYRPLSIPANEIEHGFLTSDDNQVLRTNFKIVNEPRITKVRTYELVNNDPSYGLVLKNEIDVEPIDIDGFETTNKLHSQSREQSYKKITYKKNSEGEPTDEVQSTETKQAIVETIYTYYDLVLNTNLLRRNKSSDTGTYDLASLKTTKPITLTINKEHRDPGRIGTKEFVLQKNIYPKNTPDVDWNNIIFKYDDSAATTSVNSDYITEIRSNKASSSRNSTRIWISLDEFGISLLEINYTDFQLALRETYGDNWKKVFLPDGHTSWSSSTPQWKVWKPLLIESLPGATFEVSYSRQPGSTKDAIRLRTISYNEIWSANDYFKVDYSSDYYGSVLGGEFDITTQPYKVIELQVNKHNIQTGLDSTHSLFGVMYNIWYSGDYLYYVVGNDGNPTQVATQHYQTTLRKEINRNKIDFNPDWNRSGLYELNKPFLAATYKTYTADMTKKPYDVKSVDYYKIRPSKIISYTVNDDKTLTKEKEYSLPNDNELLKDYFSVEKKKVYQNSGTDNAKEHHYLHYSIDNVFIKENLEHSLAPKEVPLNRYPLVSLNKSWLKQPINQLIMEFDINGRFYKDSKVYFSKTITEEITESTIKVEKTPEYRERLKKVYKTFFELQLKNWNFMYSLIDSAYDYKGGSPNDNLKERIENWLGVSVNLANKPNFQPMKEIYDEEIVKVKEGIELKENNAKLVDGDKNKKSNVEINKEINELLKDNIFKDPDNFLSKTLGLFATEGPFEPNNQNYYASGATIQQQSEVLLNLFRNKPQPGNIETVIDYGLTALNIVSWFTLVGSVFKGFSAVKGGLIQGQSIKGANFIFDPAGKNLIDIVYQGVKNYKYLTAPAFKKVLISSGVGSISSGVLIAINTAKQEGKFLEVIGELLEKFLDRDFPYIIETIDDTILRYKKGIPDPIFPFDTTKYKKITRDEAVSRLNGAFEIFDFYIAIINPLIRQTNLFLNISNLPNKAINYSKSSLINYILDKDGFGGTSLINIPLVGNIPTNGERAFWYKTFFFFQPAYALQAIANIDLEINTVNIEKQIPKLFTFPNYSFQVIATYLNNGSTHYQWLDIGKDGKIPINGLEIGGTELEPGNTLYTKVPKDLLPVEIISKDIYLNYNQHILEESDIIDNLQILKRVDWEDGQLLTNKDLVVLGDIGTIVNEKLRELPINQESVKSKYSESIILEPKARDFNNNFNLGGSYNFFETSDNIHREYGISYLTSYSWKMNDPTVKCIFGGYLSNITDKLKADNVFYNTTTNDIEIKQVGTEKRTK